MISLELINFQLLWFCVSDAFQNPVQVDGILIEVIFGRFVVACIAAHFKLGVKDEGLALMTQQIPFGLREKYPLTDLADHEISKELDDVELTINKISSF